MQSYWIRVGLKPMTAVLIRRPCDAPERKRPQRHEVKWCANKPRTLRDAFRTPRRDQLSPSEHPGGTNSAHTLILGSGLQICERISIVLNHPTNGTLSRQLWELKHQHEGLQTAPGDSKVLSSWFPPHLWFRLCLSSGSHFISSSLPIPLSELITSWHFSSDGPQVLPLLLEPSPNLLPTGLLLDSSQATHSPYVLEYPLAQFPLSLSAALSLLTPACTSGSMYFLKCKYFLHHTFR